MISVFSAEYPAQGATKTVQGLPWEARLSRPALKGNLAELRVTLTAGGSVCSPALTRAENVFRANRALSLGEAVPDHARPTFDRMAVGLSCPLWIAHTALTTTEMISWWWSRL
ncbi:MAG: hypothetical protein JO313_06670 [Verrucomicrobia bacterium]|nr:hypothetical protein [Verrucomicrobiota bacterium]